MQTKRNLEITNSDIKPKPLEVQPVKPIEELVREALHNLDGVKVEVPKVEFNWSDAGNLVKRLIVDLTLMVYNSNLGIKFWAIIIVVVIFLLFKLLNIF